MSKLIDLKVVSRYHYPDGRYDNKGYPEYKQVRGTLVKDHIAVYYDKICKEWNVVHVPSCYTVVHLRDRESAFKAAKFWVNILPVGREHFASDMTAQERNDALNAWSEFYRANDIHVK